MHLDIPSREGVGAIPKLPEPSGGNRRERLARMGATIAAHEATDRVHLPRPEHSMRHHRHDAALTDSGSVGQASMTTCRSGSI